MAYSNKGLFLYNLGRQEEVLDLCDKALRITIGNPPFTLAYIIKGLLWKNLRLDEAAIECYNKALAIDPQFDMAYSHKALSLKNLGREQEALDCYNKALRIHAQRRDTTTNCMCWKTNKLFPMFLHGYLSMYIQSSYTGRESIYSWINR